LTAGAALASMLALGACQAAPEPPERTPADFSLSLTLLAPGATQSQSLRPVWYVVEPDGTLRAAIGQRMPSTRLPVPIRRLDAREREALWTRVRSADLASSAPRDVAAELAPPASPPAVPTAIIELAHSGTRRAIWIPLSDAGARDRLRAVTGELDRLARRGTPSLE
jgi:hypothetical protein